MTKKIKSGRGLKRTGIFLIITGFLPFTLAWLSWLIPAYHMGMGTFGLLQYPMQFVGALLYWRGRQYAARAVAERVISDSKTHVLYLRGFGTDPSISGYVVFGLPTPEEQLRDVLQPFGDLVAIGKPSETLPTPGAARLYASDAEWKKVVIDQMQSARLVVIRAGISEGLLWELKEAVQVVNPKKLLILILSMRKKHYEVFRKEADQIFNATFPKVHELTRFRRVSGFVRFSPNWSANFLPLRAPFFSVFRGSYGPYGRLFKFTLRLVFEEYGLEWKPPPVSIRVVSVVVVSMGIGVLTLLKLAMSFLNVGSLFSR